jgi:ABC-type sugar transport system ATPase subunit/ribose/xylose/arabinose/galactoside ABC-type transport system permease subunit
VHDAAPLIELVGVSRSYPGVRALDRVSFDVLPGEVHALVGENGAGKSTLINILSGLVAADSGEIRFDGRAVTWDNPVQARLHGIVTVHQEAELFPTLSVAENMALEQGLPAKWGWWVEWRRVRNEAASAVALLGEPLDIRQPAGQLSVAMRHMTQIAAAVTHRARVLILDEPTSALTARETDWLCDQIARLKRDGVGIVYISHRHEEVFRLADRITVLRDGHRVWSGPPEAIDRDQLVRHMVGREYAATVRRSNAGWPGQDRLVVAGFSDVDGRFSNISLAARSGEVLAIYGLVGSGRTEWAQTVFGLRRAAEGTITVDGRRLTSRRPADAVAAGIAYLPEDRLREGLFRGLSVRANTVLAAIRELSRGGLASIGREQRATREQVQSLGIKCRDVEQPVGELSGGNQQKVVLARWLLANPKVLILDEPTRGVDLGAKVEIHRLLAILADSGVAIVMISSDLAEALAHSDRLAVFREGQISREFVTRDATPEQVTSAALPLESGTQIFARRRAIRSRRISTEAPLACAVVAVFVALGLTTGSFFSFENISGLLASASVLTILSLGAALVILAGAIDISLGSILALSAGVAGVLLKLPYAAEFVIPLAVCGGLATGAVLGLTNAALSIVGRVHPIVITLGTMTIYRGVLLGLTGGDTITDLPRAFTSWATSPKAGLHGSGIVGIATAVLAAIFLGYTRWGRHLLAVGSSPSAARLAGISRARAWLVAFGCGGLLAATAGLVELSQTGALQSGMGTGYELQAIAAAVIGGVSISGGRGSVLGVCLGAILLSTIYNGLVLWQVSGHHYALVTGLLLLTAVLADRLWGRSEP